MMNAREMRDFERKEAVDLVQFQTTEINDSMFRFYQKVGALGKAE